MLSFPFFNHFHLFFFVGMPAVGNHHNVCLLASLSCQISKHPNPLRSRLLHLCRSSIEIYICVATLPFAPLRVQFHLAKCCQLPSKRPLALHHRPLLLRRLRILAPPRIVQRNIADHLARKRHPPVPTIPPTTKILHRQTLTVIHRSYFLCRIHLSHSLLAKRTCPRYRPHITKIPRPRARRPLYHSLTSYPYPYCILQSVIMLLLCPPQPLKPTHHLLLALIPRYRSPHHLKHLTVETLSQPHHIARQFPYRTRRHKPLLHKPLHLRLHLRPHHLLHLSLQRLVYPHQKPNLRYLRLHLSSPPLAQKPSHRLPHPLYIISKPIHSISLLFLNELHLSGGAHLEKFIR